MERGSFAKGGEGFGKAKEVQGSFSAFNNVMSGLDLGQKIPESKVTIDNSRYGYEGYIDTKGRPRTRVTETNKSDTSVYLKDLPRVRYEIYSREGEAQQRARQNINYKSKWK